jgi:hypothetical protein
MILALIYLLCTKWEVTFKILEYISFLLTVIAVTLCTRAQQKLPSINWKSRHSNKASMPEMLHSVFDIKEETSLEEIYFVLQYKNFQMVSFAPY